MRQPNPISPNGAASNSMILPRVYDGAMSAVDEVKALEERLRLAELAPDPSFFQEFIANDAILDHQRLKSKVVEAHQPGKGPKFTKVEMKDMEFVDRGLAVVVTCKGRYTTAERTFELAFMRVWMKTPDGWRIIAATTTP